MLEEKNPQSYYNLLVPTCTAVIILKFLYHYKVFYLIQREIFVQTINYIYAFSLLKNISIMLLRSSVIKNVKTEIIYIYIEHNSYFLIKNILKIKNT